MKARQRQASPNTTHNASNLTIRGMISTCATAANRTFLPLCTLASNVDSRMVARAPSSGKKGKAEFGGEGEGGGEEHARVAAELAVEASCVPCPDDLDVVAAGSPAVDAPHAPSESLECWSSDLLGVCSDGAVRDLSFWPQRRRRRWRLQGWNGCVHASRRRSTRVCGPSLVDLAREVASDLVARAAAEFGGEGEGEGEELGLARAVAEFAVEASCFP
eukprot:CAMPEP_0180204862 /NCGR_PEP_ID=MMETSP0987-20121128/8658_1 /TAXON_ID=697907 /ORGANISM="non described non described, Strain CCMP2293" /LENGTH=217 /DNA_ID=CAMNT_0022160421 /DNA_START=105 /DNA_END=756 /DNA_ORIENTATION=+